ncbi:hypothetical protein RIF29_42348 [Crotalaria pallida]|uniref:SAP domain-containing protein n=1 Tax=Crotalaria pallida TaxID=3830 RepID=A0AAN9ECB3_CROPI
MSSPCPILDNRPIDQWKVTELKEELKKRKLPIKGLKEDLIKRLDEALQIEREAAAEVSDGDEAKGLDGDVAEPNDSETVTVVAEVVDTIVKKSDEMVELEVSEKDNAGIAEPGNVEKIPEVVEKESNKIGNVDGVSIPVDISSSVPAADQEVEHKDFPAAIDSENVREELIVHASTIETTVTVTESVSKEVVSGQDSYSAEPQKVYGDAVTKQENEGSKVWLDIKESKPLVEGDLKPPCEDLMPNSCVPENQVSEVKPSVGSQVKSDSISNDYESINKKIELNDTIIADNVKLEQDVVKEEMVEEPSSKNDVPVNDESHSMDVEELPEKKAYIEGNSNNNESPDLNKTSSGDDVGYPEKLKLDRSSGDEPMEEDLLEYKQFDSKFNVDDLGDKGANVKVSILEEEITTAVVRHGLSSVKSGTCQVKDIPSVSPVEKRTFHDQATVGTNQPAKRQRRWYNEIVKGSDTQNSTVRSATTPKVEPVALKRNFSRFNSSGIDDAPKERIVPPSQRTPTNSLRIDRFLRPFTIKAVQELLGKNGNVINFWMDQIKTHCYVTYSSVEEATETRNAVYNLQWPPKGGHLLVAEYVDPQEVKMKLEAPPLPVASVSSDSKPPPATAASQPEPSPRQHREQPLVPASLPPPPPLSQLPPAVREQLPSPPPFAKKVHQPIVSVTLDDLFPKTRATPRIYYRPLSEEQVAAKLAAQGKSIKSVGH